MLPVAGISAIYNVFGGYKFDVTGLNLLACTVLAQPLNTLNT